MHFIKYQSHNHIIDISNWIPDSNYEKAYPQGARTKKAVFSDFISPNPFIKPNFRYMFKESFERYPDQFWAEIIAYKVACEMRIHVPPTFVAIDGKKCGALIEWFYDENASCFLRYIEGSTYFLDYIDNFDLKKGTQHNLTTLFSIFNGLNKPPVFSVQKDWFLQLGLIFLFDALIGNTDRHQDNWGTVVCLSDNDSQNVKVAPAFDNGTSLGHEILPKNFCKYNNPKMLTKYIERGTHHLREKMDSKKQIKHLDLIGNFLPTCKLRLLKHLGYLDLNRLKSTLLELEKFDLSVPISKNRLLFMHMLLTERYHRIKEKIENI